MALITGFCNKHNVPKWGEIYDYTKKEDGSFKEFLHRSVCPLCEQIFNREVIFEKFKDKDMVYFQKRLMEALKIPSLNYC